jgi:hypothetical protein
MPFVLPHDIIAGEPIVASKVQENFEAIEERLNALPTEGYAQESVTGDKIADDAIVARHISAGSIPPGALQPGAVMAGNIANGAVTEPAMGTGTLKFYQSEMVNIAPAATYTYSISGFDATRIPLIQVYYFDATLGSPVSGGDYVIDNRYNSGPIEGGYVATFGYSGGVLFVKVENRYPVSRDFLVVVVGRRA